jgi:hypothetical protein
MGLVVSIFTVPESGSGGRTWQYIFRKRRKSPAKNNQIVLHFIFFFPCYLIVSFLGVSGVDNVNIPI